MRLGAGWVSTLLQRLVVEIWRDPQVTEAVRRARGEYALRREALLAALATRGVPALGRTGINVWVPVADESAALAVLRERGWAAAPGSRYRLASPPGLRLTVSTLAASDVDALADALAAAVSARHGALAGLTR